MQYICKICNQMFHFRSFKKHLLTDHNLDIKSYYDSYVKQPEEGICLNCKQETKFYGYKYAKFCSRSCATKYLMSNPNYRQQISEKQKAAWQSKSEEEINQIIEKRLNTLYDNQLKVPVVEPKRKYKQKKLSKPKKRFIDSLKEAGISYQLKYSNKKFPWPCDIYIPQRKLFIQFNLYWYHGSRPYNANSQLCKKQLKLWKRKAQSSTSYQSAINIWTMEDVRKREWALENNFNYLEIFTEKQLDKIINNIHELL